MMTKEDVDAWHIAYEETKQLCRYKDVCINAKTVTLDLYEYHINNHYDIIYNLIDSKKDLKNNRWYRTKVSFKDNFHDKYTFPIVELNYKSYSKHSIYSYIPDSVFFTIPDRLLAYNSCIEETKYCLDNIGYLNMSEAKLIDFLSKRLIKKTKNKTQKRIRIKLLKP